MLGLFDGEVDEEWGVEDGDPAVATTARPNGPSDPEALPMPLRSRLLALAHRLLDVLPNPSAARDLALALVRELEQSALAEIMRETAS